MNTLYKLFKNLRIATIMLYLKAGKDYRSTEFLYEM